MNTGAADTTPPSASITSPSNGSVVSNNITVDVSASDNVGVTKVELYLDSALAGSTTAASLAFSLDTTTVANGAHTLQAKAYDAAGNSATSASVTVTVQNVVPDTTPPFATILSPTSGATVLSTISVNVSSSDNVGVTKVEWYLDGALAGSSTSAAPNFVWNTANNANGSHTLQAKAYDAAGNAGVSAGVSVTVSNTAAPLVPPQVQIISPNNSSTITSKITKVYTATSDTAGVVRADLIVDGKLYSSLTMSPPASSWKPVFSWNTSKIARGAHTLQSAAYDSAGNTNRSSIVTVYK
jgi:hypothetical protein